MIDFKPEIPYRDRLMVLRSRIDMWGREEAAGRIGARGYREQNQLKRQLSELLNEAEA